MSNLAISRNIPLSKTIPTSPRNVNRAVIFERPQPQYVAPKVGTIESSKITTPNFTPILSPQR